MYLRHGILFRKMPGGSKLPPYGIIGAFTGFRGCGGYFNRREATP